MGIREASRMPQIVANSYSVIAGMVTDMRGATPVMMTFVADGTTTALAGDAGYEWGWSAMMPTAPPPAASPPPSGGSRGPLELEGIPEAGFTSEAEKAEEETGGRSGG